MGVLLSVCVPDAKRSEEPFGASAMVYRNDTDMSAPSRFAAKHTGAGAVTRAPRPGPGPERREAVSPIAVEPLAAEPLHAVDTPAVPDGKGGGKGKFDPSRKLRAEIAEMNYKMRNTWPVPPCRYVSFQEVERGRAKVAPVCQAPQVTFSKWSTADALLKFGKVRGKETCGLNFANGEQVGGGYKTGALAQEEDLCRRIPNLYTSLLNAKRAAEDRMYPFGPCTCRSPDRPEKYSDVLFTSDLVVARAAEEYNFEVLPPEQQVKTSLVTAAAPNINFAKEISDLKLMRNSVEAIFIAPRLVRKDINTLVLGAWGCGAFGGDPKEISELFSSVLAELGSLYQEVHFAIPGGKSGTNGRVFWETLSRRFDVKDIS